MPVGTPTKAPKTPFVPHNPSGKAVTRTLPPAITAITSQPREKKGEHLIEQSFVKAVLISEQIQQALLRPGKKDWNLIRNQVWCYGVVADKVLNTLENSEEIRIKLPSQLQEGVKLMVQLQIERAGSSVSPSAPETVRETVQPTENTTIPINTTAYDVT